MVHRSPDRSLVDTDVRTRPRRFIVSNRTIFHYGMDGFRSGNQRVHDSQVAWRDADARWVGCRVGYRGAVGMLELQVYERDGL
jgi:hypothetical protein